MVRQLDYRWNHLCSGLYLIQEKLVNLGMVLVNGEVTYFNRREVGNV